MRLSCLRTNKWKVCAWAQGNPNCPLWVSLQWFLANIFILILQDKIVQAQMLPDVAFSSDWLYVSVRPSI